jgi:DNA-binding protein H-NS
MTQINLDAMDLKELRQLQKEVTAAIETFEARRKEKVRQELEELARSRGYSLTEVVTAPPVRARKSAPVGVAKYRHPENPKKTWTGRGRRPDWVNAALASGASLESLRIGG